MKWSVPRGGRSVSKDMNVTFVLVAWWVGMVRGGSDVCLFCHRIGSF